MRMTSTRVQAAVALGSLLLALGATAQDANITLPVAEIERLAGGRAAGDHGGGDQPTQGQR